MGMIQVSRKVEGNTVSYTYEIVGGPEVGITLFLLNDAMTSEMRWITDVYGRTLLEAGPYLLLPIRYEMESETFIFKVVNDGGG